MQRDVNATRSTRRPLRLLLTALLGVGAAAAGLPAQEVNQALPAAPAPAAPVLLTLEDCLQLAFEKQPALAAARASLAGAQDGLQSLNNLPRFANCLARDLKVRKQQACHGITIAQAALWQAEWETRYAVTRNYFSVIYVRMQQDLLRDVLAKLAKGRKTAATVLKNVPEAKVTQIDLEVFDVNIEMLRSRGVEATVGLPKAMAALREAIGVGPDYPLDLAPGKLPALVPDLNREQLIQLALANRGEITQAASASRVSELEVIAQGRKMFAMKVGTFAGGSDIHATPIPQGVANGVYRPGAFGLEMPPMLVGRKDDRVAHAADLSQRAAAVVDKAQNLVALETEDSYLKWAEAKEKLGVLTAARPKAAAVADKIYTRLNEGNANGSDYIQATTLVDQIQAQANEALYLHALALAGLERITAGGYRVYPAPTQP